MPSLSSSSARSGGVGCLSPVDHRETRSLVFPRRRAISAVAFHAESRALNVTEPTETYFLRFAAIAQEHYGAWAALSSGHRSTSLTTADVWALLNLTPMATAKKERSSELKGLGRRARHARERIGYGVREAADAVGVDNSSLSRLEAGKRLMDMDDLIRLARLYRCPVGWLIAEDQPLPPLDEGGGFPQPAGDRRRVGDT